MPISSPLSIAQYPSPAIVITGASEGIGASFARLLALDERALVFIARDADALTALADECAAKGSANCHVLPLDLAEPSAALLVEMALGERGLYADVVINNAGIGLGGRFDTHNAQDVEQILAVNMAALVRLSHRFLPGMIERRRGGLLNVASLAGTMPGPFQALYFASKAFVLSLSEAIASELQDSGVTVMAAAPGPVETGIHHAMKTRWSWYRRLFPSYGADEMAYLLWQSFLSGERVAIPELVNNVAALSARFLPNDILLPIVRFLIRPRRRSGEPAR